MLDPLREGRAALIGCGKMGEAMLSGWMSSDDAQAARLRTRGFDVVVPDPARRQVLEELYGARVHESAGHLPADVSLVILAVKPQVMDGVLDELAASSPFLYGSPLVVSIAAGIPTARIEESLAPGAHIVRVMPNMPLQVQAGASVVAKGAHATSEEAAFVNELFCALGISEVVDEALIDVACALSGGGPAYFAHLAECLATEAVDAGLSPDLAYALARQTLAGTGEYLASGLTTLAELRESVCSPGGTTLAALSAMETTGFEEAARAGVRAAIARAKELSTC